MANVYEAVITYQGADQLWSNVLHFSVAETGAFRPDEYADAMLTSFEGDIYPPLLDCLSTTVHIASAMAKRVTGGGSVAVTHTYALADFPGTRAGEIGNSSENIVVEFPVLLNAKNVSGKMFISGILDSDIENNEFADTIKTRANAVGTTLLSTFTMASGHGDYHYVVYNRATGFFASPTWRRLSPVVGSQRRRLRP